MVDITEKEAIRLGNIARWARVMVAVVHTSDFPLSPSIKLAAGDLDDALAGEFLWREHSLDGCPVAPHRLVDVRFSDGMEVMALAAARWDEELPEESHWFFCSKSAYITHYRMAE